MPIAFPSSPTQGQTTVTGGRTWTWDGVSWTAVSTVDLIAVSSNVTPVSTLAYDLGSSSLRWRDLYMSGNTIDLGGTAIKSSANGVSFTSAANAAAAVPLTVSSLQIASATGNVVTLQATATGLQTVATSGNVVATTPGGSSGHVQYNLAGAFAGSANLTFNGTTLTARDITDSSLTAGRVTYSGAAGNLADSANLTFDGTTVTMAANPVLSAGTANGVMYLNGSKVATTGSALTFDGSTFWVAASSLNSDSLNVNGFRFGSGTFKQQFSAGFDFQQYYTAAGQASPQASILVDTAAWGVKITGTEQMRLTSTGLGIGTSSPAARLHVSNGSGCQLYVGLSNNIYEQAYDHIWQTLSGAATKMTLDSSGNLGLGVAPSAWSGWRAFEFANGKSLTGYNSGGALALTQNTFFNGSNWIYKGSAAASLHTLEANGSFAWFTAGSGTAGNAISFTQAMTLNASGNLGIGTSSPVAKLDIISGTNTTLSVPAGVVAKFSGSVVINSLNTGGAGNVDSLYFQKSHGSGINISNYDLGIIRSYTSNGYAGGLDFYTGKLTGPGAYAATFAMRIDDNQNLGIGTTTPGTKLHVTGSNGFFAQFLNSTDGTGAGVALGSSTNLGRISSNGASTALSFEINGTERIRMTSGGDFGIGTNNPNSKLHVNGKITQSSYALDQLNGGNQFVEIRGGSRTGTGIYSLFTRGNSNAQSSGKVYVQAIYGTPATSGYWEYIISGNLNIALIASNISIYSGSVPSIYWDVNTLKVNNTNSNVYYSIIVELHNIGIGWGATWGDFPGFVS